jgi:hypothetical protein
LRDDVLSAGDRRRVVLGYADSLLLTASSYHYLATALVSATNDWTVAQWLDRDKRLFGMILVYAGLPASAAAEITRIGHDERMVAVALGANGLSNLFGHPVYHPIYEAAAALSLPIVLQVGSDSAADLATDPVAGGIPTTFGEYRALSVQPMMTHLASMITEGVFEKFPTLKVLVLGGGLTWVASWLWRVSYWFKTLEREAPWLRRSPEEYFFDHVRLSTYSVETVPTTRQLVKAMSPVAAMQHMIVYASGAPSTDALSLEATLERFPAEWHDDILYRTAEDLFRWPEAPPESTGVVTESAVTVGETP